MQQRNSIGVAWAGEEMRTGLRRQQEQHQLISRIGSRPELYRCVFVLRQVRLLDDVMLALLFQGGGIPKP